MSNAEKIINDAWEYKDQINQNSEELIINAINQIIEDLDQGKVLGMTKLIWSKEKLKDGPKKILKKLVLEWSLIRL